jgi:cytosine/adenosine deaminase-related metal-dependent hydrolase
MKVHQRLNVVVAVALLSGAIMLGAQPVSRALGRGALTPGTWAITGATVITMRGDSVIRDATLLVRDGRIAGVGRRAEVRVPRDARVIDGRGRYVIPGLADMHAHLYADEWVPDSIAPYELGVMVAHGVTTARLMIGTPTHLALRASVQAGQTVGPQLWVASPQLSGDSAVNTWLVRTPDAARRAVRDARTTGYDFIKLTTNITPDVFDAVVVTAGEERLKVTGHVDPRVGVARALAAHQQIEHFDNYMESVLADSAPTRTSVSDVGAYRVANWATLDHVDMKKVDAIAGATARAGVAVTPTLAFFRLWFATPATDDEVRARPDYAHIPATMRTGYERARARYWQNPPSSARRQRYIEVRNRLVRAVIDSGGTILAGSDGPGGLMGYGWGLHRELEMLVAAGLTPHQALHTATRAPAAWLGAEAEWGSITTGKRADLVLLDANPLEDIKNTSAIRGVAIGGRWIDADARVLMLENARRRLNP